MSNTKITPYANDKEMAAYGLPDFAALIARQPSLTMLRAALPGSDFTRISACTRSSSRQSKHCEHPLCPRCATNLRKKLIKGTTELAFNERLRAVMVTITDPDCRVRQGDLKKKTVSSILEEVPLVTTSVLKAQHGPAMMVGGLDLALNEDPDNMRIKRSAKRRKQCHHWAPHVHIVLICRDPMKAAARLGSELSLGHVPNGKPFRIDQSHCLGRHIAYVTKLNLVRRAVTSDERGNVNRKSRPLARKHMKEALTWFSQAGASERIFTFYKPE